MFLSYPQSYITLVKIQALVYQIISINKQRLSQTYNNILVYNSILEISNNQLIILYKKLTKIQYIIRIKHYSSRTQQKLQIMYNSSSRTSLAQRNELRQTKSNVSSGVHLGNQLSSKRLSVNFPIDTHINMSDELNRMRILDKYNKYSEYGSIGKQTYKGDLKNGKKEGFGTYMFKNNDQYIGYWDNDKMHGMGVYGFHSADSNQKILYLGEFSEGLFHGIGKLVAVKNDSEGQVIYQGFWLKGQKCGLGVYFYSPDTSVYYEGYWQNDMKNGEGQLLFKNGQFSGNWLNNKKHGYGKLKVQNRQRTLYYEGQWVNDQIPNGEIIYISNHDSMREGSYKGQIRNGKRHGQGTFQFKNIFVQGIFDNDAFTGKGRLYNDIYNIEGDLLASKSNLKGTIKYTNGDIFEGVLDLSTGLIKRKEGVYKFSNGDLADGKFDDQGKGDIIGLFQYLWNSGEKKKFDN